MICKRGSNVIYADFPTPLERKLLDLPLPEEDDGLAIPPFDSFNPFGSRARTSPLAARAGAPASSPPDMPEPRFINLTKHVDFIVFILCLVTVFLVMWVVTP